MASPVIEIKHIKKEYVMGSQVIAALKDVSLSINKGEYVALMGPSGSGKSTLMNILGCLDSPSAGSYRLNNTEVAEMTDDQLALVRNKEIGFIFQTFNLLPRLTALENVALPMVYAGMSKADRTKRAEEVMTMGGLQDRMTHKPNELSGGQQQRVAVARSLVLEPSVMLFDEPLSNLDARLRRSMREEIRALQQRLKLTVAYVTHDQSEALAVSDQ
ncbi:MAG TPA: ABC transporter ATP-binding protein, partial [Chitinophagales bacterium]|nr:ABC transporter ATP-binding protein [Chitinophagales bacterium]